MLLIASTSYETIAQSVATSKPPTQRLLGIVSSVEAKPPGASITAFGGLALSSVASGYPNSKGYLECALIGMGHENREIATLLNIEVASDKMTKYWLKKKLAFDESVDLTSYFETL